MLKKEVGVKWTLEAKKSFELVKHALTQAPILISPDFTKYFLIFSFASEHIVATIRLQKNPEGQEQPIAFFSKALRDAPMKYNIMEKQAYVLVKALKDFRVYILHSHIIAFVPNIVVKDILSQDPNGKRGKWIVVILEYDLEIKPTKLIKGQGFVQLMAKSNLQALDIKMVDALDEHEGLPAPTVEEQFQNSSCYADILYVLTNLNAPPDLSKTKARLLNYKARNYCILNECLYWKNANGLLLKCLLEVDEERIKHEFHERECGGHLY